MEFYPETYNEYLKYNNLSEYKVLPIYKTEEFAKMDIQQNGAALLYMPIKYRTEELLFMAQQTNLYYNDIPTEVTKRIFEIYETMGE